MDPEKDHIVAGVCERWFIVVVCVFKWREKGAHIEGRGGGIIDGVLHYHSELGRRWASQDSREYRSKYLKQLGMGVKRRWGSESLAHYEWGDLLYPEKGEELREQEQALHNLACDRGLWTASSEAHGPVFVQTGGTHQSERGTESVRPHRSLHHHGISWLKIRE